MTIDLDPDQLRILNWRMNSGGVAGVIGPAGCGKTTTGSFMAVKLVCEEYARKVLLIAYTNSAANEFSRELSMILGSEACRFLCVRSGYAPGSDSSLPIPFSNNIEDVRAKKIVICTTQSLRRLSGSIKFDNMIIDEVGIERLEHLLSPFTLGINQLGVHLMKDSISYETNNIIELASQSGIVATVIGDPKQSRPIGLADYDLSAIEWVLRCAKSDTLFTTHRLPDKLAMLVDELVDYGGLKSASEISNRRLSIDHVVGTEFKDVINPEEVVTWVDLNGIEEMAGPTSWYNDVEAKACVRICRELKRVAPLKSISIVTRYTEQRRIISNYLQNANIGVRVLTTTGALGTQADIVLFSIVRNNPERLVGAVGSLQDLNVAVSRSKEKLIIVGSFDMMLNGRSKLYGRNKHVGRNLSCKLANQVDKKYGQVVEAPLILTR
jgi:energy-coupling factor transporter ATP-binding protein EcfA2